MIKFSFIIFGCFIFSLAIPNCRADDMPSVECLYDSVFIDMESNYTAEVFIKQKFRFNEPGNSVYSFIKISVNRFVEFSLIDVTHDSPDGRSITLDNDDIEAVSDFGPGFYPDSKTMIINLPFARAGASAVIAYKLKYKSLIYLPQLFRQRDIPTRISHLGILSDIPYTYFISPDDFTISRENEQLIIKANNIPAYGQEEFMPANVNFRVIISPDTIFYGGEGYSFQSWSDVASFYNQLSIEKTIPSGQISNLARNLCGEVSSFVDTLRTLFNFVRDNIRYISVDLGRGDFKPLSAEQVYRKKYGDCKDQSTLLIALCQSLGIKADPALITTRSKPDVIADLPWPGYFDHVITAVDTGDGYLFLDASQPTCCFGQLSPELRNRRALICGTDPFLDFTLTSAHDLGNQLSFNLVYDINPGGEYRCDVKLKLFRDPAFKLYSLTGDYLTNRVIYTFLGGNFTHHPADFRVERNSSSLIEITGHYFGELPKTPRGNRLLININSFFFDYLKKYFTASTRKNPYSFDFTFNINETVHINLPDGYQALKDSLALSFNERGLDSKLVLVSESGFCSLVKKFRLFDYVLSADRYNRFFDFLLVAAQAPYNSIEIFPESIQLKDENVIPDSL